MFSSPGTDTCTPFPRIWLSFQAVVLYLRARGWIWEWCPDTEPKKLYWQASERFFNLFSFCSGAVSYPPWPSCGSLQLWGYPPSSARQWITVSAPKCLTLVGIASSSCGALSLCCSKFVLQGPQGFQLSFQFRREVSILLATVIAQLYIFTFVFSKEKATNRLHKGWDAPFHTTLCIRGGRGVWVLETCLCPAKFKPSWQ